MTDPDDRAAMRAQADRLGFDVDDAVVADCLATAERLAATAGALDAAEPGTVEPADPTPTGPGNALLATYDEPRRERETGPLAGLTVGVKDNLAVAGLATTCGADAVGFTPGTDASPVERLLGAGAAVLGKTNMDALALGPSGEFSDYGPVENPRAPDRVPGGTSSGSGVAVAAGAVDAALGTDTGGSVRIPAACCGVVGSKPTHGLVPRDGLVAFAPSLDTVGPLAGSVADAARTLAATAGPTPRDPTASAVSLPPADRWLDAPDPLTVGLPDAFFAATADPTATAVRAAVADADGLRAEPVALEPGAVAEAYLVLGAAEFVWYLDQGGTVRGLSPGAEDGLGRAVAALRRADLGDHVARRLLPAAYLDATTEGGAYRRARREATAFDRRCRAALSGVDALVTPTIRCPPPERGRTDSTEAMLSLLGNTAPFNLSGHPAVSVPVAGPAGDALPAAAQVVTPRFADPLAHAVAARLAG
jgi:aspartyl-tRNA(Asn)/glutamyl-tRNA(Gln) amidotransferase subunit A